MDSVHKMESRSCVVSAMRRGNASGGDSEWDDFAESEGAWVWKNL